MKPPRDRSGDRIAFPAAAAVAFAAAAAVLVGLALTPVSPAATGQAIRSPDGAAACVISAGRLLCSNRTSQLRDTPYALTLEPGGEPRVVKRTIGWSDQTAALRPGRPRRLGNFSCRLVDEALFCRNPAGAAIAASKDRLSALLAPAVSP